jgi:hypothetical protein
MPSRRLPTTGLGAGVTVRSGDRWSSSTSSSKRPAGELDDAAPENDRRTPGGRNEPTKVPLTDRDQIDGAVSTTTILVATGQDTQRARRAVRSGRMLWVASAPAPGRPSRPFAVGVLARLQETLVWRRTDLVHRDD